MTLERAIELLRGRGMHLCPPGAWDRTKYVVVDIDGYVRGRGDTWRDAYERAITYALALDGVLS